MLEPAEELEQEEAKAERQAPRHRGIYLLPNLVTTVALFSGFYAILASMDGKFEAAAIAIFVAMVFDGLDGRVARMTNTESEFGVEYDSLSDMVSFGVAPAVVCYSWMLSDLGKVGWAAAFLYVSCAALRLARFNVQVESADSRYFVGLASPSAAALVAGMVWVGHDLEPSAIGAMVAFLVTGISGLLMVVNCRYHSLKGFDFKGHVPFVTFLAVVVGMVVVAIEPGPALLSLAALYALSGPVFWCWLKLIRKSTD
ncbi:CDP-diacylglycerol--serine O-phosphatidyltransferase [Gammaproteobacteria bacterium 53_120_T64]|nr:CDP-diacylglycerol--serine O-phosphatidyltransferase [Gammaproteobacteria bacterium 53_120_T64]